MRRKKSDIKFRVWCNITKKMHPLDAEDMDVAFDSCDIEIMQYTGVKVKDEQGNVVELYEGDIVKVAPESLSVIFGSSGEYTEGEIVFINAGFNVCQAGFGRTLLDEYINCDCCPADLIVIGNIYERKKENEQPNT